MNTFRLRTGDLEWCEFDGDIVALDLRSSVYLTVNRAGAVLWPALVQGVGREELVAGLGEAFGLDESVARRDVDAFLDSLRERRLLEG